ncbi:TetR/AcrR family transcriptional regulator [Legionella fallonii]|nr:TetR/AcrR family transcriptional regulator [Legionella fallonii]
MNYTETQENILNAAESLIQKRGYNAFSYKDISAIVGIKTSSIHYHYPSKEDLAVAVIDWQLHKIVTPLDEIKGQKELSAKEKLIALIDAITALTYNDEKKMCLGGMLASDALSLPESVQSKARYFFNILYYWIEEVLAAGRLLGEVNLLYPIDDFAHYLILQIEGSLLMSRLYGDAADINLVKQFINHVMM